MELGLVVERTIAEPHVVERRLDGAGEVARAEDCGRFDEGAELPLDLLT